MENTPVKPCPFCGTEVDITDSEALHPSGSGWKDRPDGFRSYHSFREAPEDQWCWTMHCVSAGCCAEITADSKQEAIDKWNTRV